MQTYGIVLAKQVFQKATPRGSTKSSPAANAACLYVYHYAHSLATITSLYEFVSRTPCPSIMSEINDEVCRCTTAFDGLQPPPPPPPPPPLLEKPIHRHNRHSDRRTCLPSPRLQTLSCSRTLSLATSHGATYFHSTAHPSPASPLYPPTLTRGKRRAHEGGCRR